MEKPWKKLPFWRSKARFVFKILLALGFVMQSVKFLEMYLQYPSMVELDVSQPHEVEFPAFTLCNLNEIRVSAFCGRYPKKCVNIDSDPTYCVKYPEYCRLVRNTTKMLPVNRISEYNLSREELREFGHQINDLMVSCKIEIEGNEEDCKGDPILISVLSHSDRLPFNCFMFYSLYERPHGTPMMVPTSTVIRMTLNVEVSEYHPEHLSRGARRYYSPHVPSPPNDGQISKTGAIYRFYVRQSRMKLLPPPFKSHCRDYMSEWYKNGGKGPVTQKKYPSFIRNGLRNVQRVVQCLAGCRNPELDWWLRGSLAGHLSPSCVRFLGSSGIPNDRLAAQEFEQKKEEEVEEKLPTRPLPRSSLPIQDASASMISIYQPRRISIFESVPARSVTDTFNKKK
ncbi:uncharacterized protein TNIN_223651 [Trichonephila inaurata madagascariensis]|uniref:Amiloride-sensitive sodium channel n=1 Tax=Trichonephila inaurata madagascariensis TaxID=2747483 RepID=A0A8X6XSB6_9ARAC|nr:uncharacterized protein TNIN_223651 [Trichonephila inaurata madagascariensis]